MSSAALLSCIRFVHRRFPTGLVLAGAFALLLPVAARAQTYTSSGGITASGTYEASEGSTITVTGLSGTVTSMSLTLTNLNVTNLNSVAMVLVPPGGSGLTPLDLLSGICGAGTQQVANSTFTLADTEDTGTSNTNGMLPGLGISTCPTALTGTYLPTDYLPGQDTFNSPGPSTYNSAGTNPSTDGSGTFNFSSFGTNGSILNGSWTLYIANQDSTGSATPSGSLGSWSITFTTAAAAATTTSLSASPNGSTSLVFTSSDVNGDATTPTSVTLTATVTSGASPVSSGTVTFYDSTGTSAGAGTVLASGIAVNSSGQAQASVTFPGSEEGLRAISAVYSGSSGYLGSTSSTTSVLTTNHPYNPSGATFCNGPITVNKSGGGSPYPSLLALGSSFSQLQGAIENVTVTLNDINLQNQAELENLAFLLQAPGSNTTGLGSSGNAFEFLSWAGNPFTSGSLTLSDTGMSAIPNNQAPSCTTCLPTDNWIDLGSGNSDTFPPPAPSAFAAAAPTGSATFTSEFGGQGANNTWSLYLDTRVIEPGAAGTIGSWCLNFTMQANAHPTTTSVSGSPNPASIAQSSTTATVTLTAKVSVTDSSGLTVDGGTVTFVDGSTNLGSSTVSNGQATLSPSLAEGTHEIVATYSGTNTGTEFGISTGKFDQRVDTATSPVSGSGAGPFTYCNSGPITIPGLGAYTGVAEPYPSNIFVTNLPGTVNAITVTLKGLSTNDQGDLLSLLVGPGGNNLDFFSLTGSSVSAAPSPQIIVFDDTAPDLIPGNLTYSGSFKPTSDNTDIPYPQCPPNAPSCAGSMVGPPLPSNPFTPTNKAATVGTSVLGNANDAGVFGGTSSSTYNGNGTWSLYLNDGGPSGGGAKSNLTSGWCVNLTENLPSASANTSHTGTVTQGQQDLPFIVNITNNGPGPTGDPTGGNNPLTVTDTLNSSFSYAGFSGTGWNCSATGQTVTCTNDSTVAQGASYQPLTINVNVSPTANTITTIPNQVQAGGGGVNSAASTSNIDAVAILPATALAVQKSHAGTFTQGQTAQWNITVTNTASSGMTNGMITLSDTLPAGYTLSSYSSTGTASWSCGGPSTVTCTTTGGIAGGAGSGVNLIVNVPATSPTSVSNIASAYGGGDLTHVSAGTAAISNTDTASVVQVPATVTPTVGGTQSAPINTAFAIPLTVVVKDAASVVIPNLPVTFTAPSSGASGTFSNSSATIQAQTNQSGASSAGTITANGVAGSYAVTASAGQASATFNLTNIDTAPTITSNPVSQTVPAGQTATFTAAATGNPAPTVQWQVSVNGGAFTNIPSATSTTLSVAGVTDSMNADQYQAVFKNAAGSTTTNAAPLTVEDYTIAATPASQTIPAGHSATSTITLKSVRGLTGNASLTCAGGPPNSKCTVNPNQVMLNSTATTTVALLPAKNMDLGTFTVTITALVDGILHSTPLTLTVK